MTNSGTVSNSGTYNADVNNAYLIYNLAGGVWNGNVLSNTGIQGIGNYGTWTGSAINDAIIVNFNGGSWVGNATNNAGGLLQNASTWTGTMSNAGTFRNDSGATLSGLLTQTAGATTNDGTLLGGLSQSGGTVSNTGTINSGATITGGSLTTTGTITGGLTNSGLVNANGGAVNGAIVNNTGASFTVSGTVTSDSTFNNKSGGNLTLNGTGNYTLGGALTNAGTVLVKNGGSLTDLAGITNSGTITVDAGGTVTDTLTNSGTVSNSGTYNADVNNSGATATITNALGGVWNGNLLSNSSGASVTNIGTWTGTANNAASLTNASGATWTGNGTNTTTGTLANLGTWIGTLNNAGLLLNSGTFTGLVTNTGALATTGVLNGGLTNSGTVNASGQVNGVVTNSGNLTVTATLTNNGGTFVQTGTGSLNIGANSFTGIGTFTNGPTSTIALGTTTGTGVLGAASLTNSGLLSMSNGTIGDRVNLSGNYAGVAGSVITADVNMGNLNNLADRIVATSTSGTSAISLKNVGTQKIYFSTPIVLVSSNGGTGSFTAANDVSTTQALASTGIVDYHIGQISGTSNWGLIASVNQPLASAPSRDANGFISTYTTSIMDDIGEQVSSQEASQPLSFWAHIDRASDTQTLTATSSDPYSTATRSKSRSEISALQFGYNVHMSGSQGMVYDLGLMAGSASNTAHLNISQTKIYMPFIGLYSVIASPHVKFDFQAQTYNLKLDPVALVSTVPVKGSGHVIRAALSFPMVNGQTTYEPFANITSSQGNIHDMNLAFGVGTLQFSKINNQTEALGIKITTTKTTASSVIKPYISLALANDSSPVGRSTFVPNGGANSVLIRTTRVGNYGQLTAGADFKSKAANIDFFLKGALRSGPSVNGYTAEVGARLRF